MQLQIQVPSILAHCLSGNQETSLHASQLDEALEILWQEYPLLKHHCLTKSGNIRPHILIYFNEDNIKWLDSLECKITEGDRLTILQAVSGGG
ncbi:MAG: MoaD/ThiS family protein [Candidatus Nitronauta litoralis]|uniref:MoaD/ThiS family protein n=1 Tax=Candidatus Nitronauta litoralis TaxID=2705533 RepID=A0A7T0BZ63_9BACT|nr:MAG: MoaD/ThiS family protein [Candidatus Nitronauta litoralis]